MPGFFFHLFLCCYMGWFNVTQLYGFDLTFAYLAMYASFRLDLSKQLAIKIGATNNEAKERKLLMNIIELNINTHKLLHYIDLEKYNKLKIYFIYIPTVLYGIVQRLLEMWHYFST